LVFDGTDDPQLPETPDSSMFFVDGAVMPKYDFNGLHHVTVMYKRWAG